MNNGDASRTDFYVSDGTFSFSNAIDLVAVMIV